MALDSAKNFSKCTVSTGYNASATTVVLSASEGAKLPTVPFNAVWYNSTDYTDPTDDPNKEIIRITNIATDTLTVTRAQESTSAATHNTGGKSYKMIAGLTAKVINTDIPAMNVASATVAFGCTLDTDVTLAANSDTEIPSQKATKTYVDTGLALKAPIASPTFTGVEIVPQIVTTNNAITASANTATVPITSRISTVTNNSAATLTITINTTSAVDGQMIMVRILDATAVAQTISWVNTENSTATVPTTSNGSTTQPLSVGFQYNSNSSKWRCIASA